MSRLSGIPARIALSMLVCAPSLTPAAVPATTSAPASGLQEAKAFAESIQSGRLDAEEFDFDAAGFFRLSPQERTQWLGGVFGGLSPVFQPGSPQCTPIALRSGNGIIWLQIAGQSSGAEEWNATARTLRARLAVVDEILKHSKSETASGDPLVQELMVRYARDQDVRNVFGQQKWTEGTSAAATSNWVFAENSRTAAIDCDNTAWLKARLADVGWFTISKYGAAADAAAWHLVQHASREPVFQREMLGKLQALPRGETDRQHLGMLFDRVALNEGRLQRFGTGGQCTDGQWTPFETEDPANLDRRRASMGMEPIAEYAKITSREACPH